MPKRPLTPEIEQQLADLVEGVIQIADIFTMHPETPVDNSDFMRIMKISRRTAQNWRDHGIISYIKIQNKIYYRVKDIKTMLDNNHHQKRSA